MGQLDHPNVVKLLGLCQNVENGVLKVFIVQEWCNRNLRMYMQRESHFEREGKAEQTGYNRSEEIAAELACKKLVYLLNAFACLKIQTACLWLLA